ncbi:membrane protein insertion efficiency factor YidD [Candidatus Gracilibacteria bacterium]|nr:MAG: membrane protein insertion efficiency factor YidD [Candidatus Gracilibacteria bacterium]
MNFLQKSLISLVRWYQKYLSPDHSIWARKSDKLPHCKYTPTCSDYMIESVEKKGFFLGFLKGMWRILRCNPWSKGGYDPVDKK